MKDLVDLDMLVVATSFIERELVLSVEKAMSRCVALKEHLAPLYTSVSGQT